MGARNRPDAACPEACNSLSESLTSEATVLVAAAVPGQAVPGQAGPGQLESFLRLADAGRCSLILCC